MKRLFSPPVFSLFAVWALVCPAPAEDLFANIDHIKKGLSEITGLAFKHDVPYALITKDQLRRYLEQRLRETMKPEETRAEELTLKMLGLVPADFDLRKNTLDLLTEQAAAFYDYNQKKLFVLEGSSEGDEERIALVHELAHALADQHFHLAKYIREGMRSDDSSAARQAVMEGQATWLMAAYISLAGGGKPEIPDSVLELMKKSIEGSAAQQYPVFSKAPLYIRESLVFPYADGIAFQDAVFQKLGRVAFSEVFLRPPAGTGQILHPRRYLGHGGIVVPEPPPLPDSRDFRKLADGTLGELDFRVLLSEYSTAAEGDALAAHLGGGSYGLFEHKREKFPVLVVASTWDSPDTARKYVEQYRRVMQGKWKQLEITTNTPLLMVGRGDSGYFRVWVDGVTVNQIEGWNAPVP
ncbi:MAG: hypothetical protein JOZ32_19205 [Bryobacterales bacterium]|nr:hypothetical protein [Bryobacterales bacterium]